jgi:hypothetical protein
MSDEELKTKPVQRMLKLAIGGYHVDAPSGNAGLETPREMAKKQYEKQADLIAEANRPIQQAFRQDPDLLIKLRLAARADGAPAMTDVERKTILAKSRNGDFQKSPEPINYLTPWLTDNQKSAIHQRVSAEVAAARARVDPELQQLTSTSRIRMRPTQRSLASSGSTGNTGTRATGPNYVSHYGATIMQEARPLPPAVPGGITNIPQGAFLDAAARSGLRTPSAEEVRTDSQTTDALHRMIGNHLRQHGSPWRRI